MGHGRVKLPCIATLHIEGGAVGPQLWRIKRRLVPAAALVGAQPRVAAALWNGGALGLLLRLLQRTGQVPAAAAGARAARLAAAEGWAQVVRDFHDVLEQARPALLEVFPWAAPSVCGEIAAADEAFWPALLAAGERVRALPPVDAPDGAPEPRSLEALRLELPTIIGCCYSGCTNLQEASEADVKTKVCSGCEVARYCSQECQRAAWRQHRRACKALRVCGQGAPA